MRYANFNKYHAKKAECYYGHVHDSKKEAERCNELHMMQAHGMISDLEIQKKFLLIPQQREPDGVTATGKPKKGKVLEREVNYIADFVYVENGLTVVEDTKGMRLADYILKRKLMLFKYGIHIREI